MAPLIDQLRRCIRRLKSPSTEEDNCETAPLLGTPRPASEKALRSIFPNNGPLNKYPENKIRTTKYSLLSFVPKCLFHQFIRVANLYFLILAILNWLPQIEVFHREITMLPLVVVIAISAFKDVLEDFRRYKFDKRVNQRSTTVFDWKEKDFVVKCWKDLRVGDFVKIVSNETIPADILLLHTSDPNGICHLETANLDGETNLKQRRVVRGISTMSSVFEPENFNSTITCDVPNSKLNHFNGHLDKPDKKRIGFGSESLLLRGCTVRNTDEATGIVVYTGHETKAMLNNNGPRYKRSKLERKMNIDVLSCVVLLFIMCLIGALGHYIWLRTFTGTAPFLIHSSDSEYVPPALSGFYTFFTMIILLQVLIPISLYVSIELVKVGQIFFITNDIDLYDDETDHQMQCRALNITEDLGQIQYVFSDKTGTLTENKMVFRRCTIMGTEYSHKENGIRLATHGEMEYDDEEDVCHLRDVPSRFKRKSKGRGTAAIRRCQSTRSYLGAQRWTDVTASPQSEVAFSSPLETDVTPDKQLLRLFCDEDSQFRAWCQVCQPCGGASYMDFFLALVICNTVVLSKTTLPRQELNGPQRFSSSLKSRGRLENLLSKVGSLRQIISSQQTISGQSSQSSQVKPPLSGSPLKEEEIEEEKEEEEEANDIASRNEDRDLCGQGGRDFDMAQVKNSGRETDGLCYEAESPDEAALVYAAKAYGFTLLAHTPDQVTVRLPQGAILTFEVLHTLAFDSTRKRMSVLVRHPFTKQVIMYTKGADSAIMDLLESQAGENQLEERKRKKIATKTQKHLDRYARDGLRTLCIAKKVLSEKTYEDWSAVRQEAESAIDNKEEQLMKTAVHLETSFTLLGATGIEDHLQDDVPDTISALREAGIQVWVLTGDKQETAVNIAYSCKLLDKEDQVFVLNTENKDECDSILGCALEEVRRCPESHQSRLFGAGMTVSGPTDVPTPTFGLVIDGRTLSLVFQADLELKFVELTRHCHSVLCCRVTPLQKSSVVQLVRRKLKVMTLAIGDGANDVNMIQAADVGIGISGQEGMQAVMASDFAIPRFKHLKKLLLVHGHWCYSRLANMIVYFFYKNVAYVNLLFWYQFYCGFSGTAMTDYWLLIFFNLFFTSAPPIMFGIMDRDISAETLLSLPELYKCGQKLEGYTRSIFWIAMLDAFYQSLICFFVPYLAYQGSDIDMFSFGIPMNTVSLCTILLHLAIEIKSWTIVHWVIMVGSLVLSFIVTMTYSATCVTCNPPSNPYWIMQKQFSDPVFYLVCVLATVLSLLPRYTLRVLQGILGLSPLIRARQLDRQNPACRDALIKEWRSATVAHSILPDLPSPVSPVPSSPEPTVHHSQREGLTSSHKPAHRRSISTMTI